MKFAHLLGLLTHENRHQIPPDQIGEYLDFKLLHEKADAVTRETAERIFTTYSEKTFYDYGDEPIISQAHNDLNVLVIHEVEQKYPDFLRRCRAHFDSVCNFTESVRVEEVDRVAKAKELQALVDETQRMLVITIINAEIVDCLYNYHLLRFDRPSLNLLWEAASPSSDAFKDFFTHSVFIGMAKHLKFLTHHLRNQWGIGADKCVRGGENKDSQGDFYAPDRNTSADGFPSDSPQDSPLMSPNRWLAESRKHPLPLIPIKSHGGQYEQQPIIISEPQSLASAELTEIFDKICKSIKSQTKLIGSYQIFMNSIATRLPCKYTKEQSYRTLFDAYLTDPVEARQVYYERLYNLGMVVDKQDPEESPVAHPFDLVLLYVHTFLHISNIFALWLSFYLYNSYLHIDPEFTPLIHGVYPFGALLFGFLWNEMTRFKSFKMPFVLSCFMEFIANLLYYFAQMTADADDPSPNGKGIAMLVIAFFIMGAGSARPMILKYFAIAIKSWGASRYYTFFVVITFMAICIGQGLHSFVLLGDFGPTSCRWMAGSWICVHNVIAFVYMLLWLLMLIVFLVFFSGYDRTREQRRRNKKFGLVHLFYALNHYGFKSPILKTFRIMRHGMTPDEISLRSRKQELQPCLSHDGTDVTRPIKTDPFKDLILQHQKSCRTTSEFDVQPTEVEIKEPFGRSASLDPTVANCIVAEPINAYYVDWRKTVYYNVDQPVSEVFFTALTILIMNVALTDHSSRIPGRGSRSVRFLLRIRHKVGWLVLARLPHLRLTNQLLPPVWPFFS
jgi:hypothetical protein